MKKLVTVLGVFLLVGVMAYPVFARGPGSCWQDRGGKYGADRHISGQGLVLQHSCWNSQSRGAPPSCSPGKKRGWESRW